MGGIIIFPIGIAVKGVQTISAEDPLFSISHLIFKQPFFNLKTSNVLVLDD